MTALRNHNCNYISNVKINFKFDGKSYFAYEGDTIASALLRNHIGAVWDKNFFIFGGINSAGDIIS